MSIKINGIKFSPVLEIENFPSNERIFNEVKQIVPALMKTSDNKIDQSIVVELYYDNDIDLLNLNIIKKYIDDVFPTIIKYLYMPYVPYSRMDRETKNEICVLKYIGQYINDLNFDSIIIKDPHSSVTPSVINKCKVIYPFEEHELLIKKHHIDYILFPDLGATKKYSTLYDYSVPYINANKIRESGTNKIVQYDIMQRDINLENKHILIIDDICSAGTTFLEASKLLKDLYNVTQVYLFVTFAEYNIYNGKMLYSDYVDEIYTTLILNTYGNNTPLHDKLHLIDLYNKETIE